MFNKGLFGDMFDFNHDGNLDSFERAAEFGAFMQMIDDGEKADALEEAGLDPDDFDFQMKNFALIKAMCNTKITQRPRKQN